MHGWSLTLLVLKRRFIKVKANDFIFIKVKQNDILISAIPWFFSLVLEDWRVRIEWKLRINEDILKETNRS
jgi:hypothetical protein